MLRHRLKHNLSKLNQLKNSGFSRSGRSQMIFKIGVLKSSQISKESTEPLCKLEKETPTQVFSFEICELS